MKRRAQRQGHLCRAATTTAWRAACAQATPCRTVRKLCSATSERPWGGQDPLVFGGPWLHLHHPSHPCSFNPLSKHRTRVTPMHAAASPAIKTATARPARGAQALLAASSPCWAWGRDGEQPGASGRDLRDKPPPEQEASSRKMSWEELIFEHLDAAVSEAHHPQASQSWATVKASFCQAQ